MSLHHTDDKSTLLYAWLCAVRQQALGEVVSGHLMVYSSLRLVILFDHVITVNCGNFSLCSFLTFDKWLTINISIEEPVQIIPFLDICCLERVDAISMKYVSVVTWQKMVFGRGIDWKSLGGNIIKYVPMQHNDRSFPQHTTHTDCHSNLQEAIG